MSKDLDFYTVLGIAQNASADEVRKAYKQRALETHPDKLKLDKNCSAEEKEKSEEKFRMVNDAFVVLSDPHQRRAYDFARRPTRQFMPDPESWADMDARNLRRAQERQAWADAQAERSAARIEALRATARRDREQIALQLERCKEDADMIAEMISALCALDSNAQSKDRKTSSSSRRAARTKTSSVPDESVNINAHGVNGY
ncbi:DnaJ-domain-containing protein [Rickenella mellea]|uniref:DnaJ-domain-containing protein n=1 Tax=Rickenella mellea TaxID=50990 RepID=A0A4Y7Q8N9_9AGAM|nr:DnaJ-domain-containing protein [Rickenella mellea]